MSANENLVREPQAIPDTAGGSDEDGFHRLGTTDSEIVLAAQPGARPRIVRWGATLAHASPLELDLLATRQWAFGGANIDLPDSLSNELGGGLPAPPGFLAHRDGRDWAATFRVQQVERYHEHALRIVCEDAHATMRATYTIEIDPDSSVLSARTRIDNLSERPLSIDWCAALCLPLDTRLQTLMTFAGRWAGEFQTESIGTFRGSVVRENRRGRTSHDQFPGLIACAPETTEQAGPAAGFHLAWSGNHRVRVDRLSDARAFVQIGELFLPGEFVLAAGGHYTSPTLLAAWSDHGLSGLSQQFHTHILKHAGGGRLLRKPRPVHYNTWEAIYFDHSEARVLALVDRAAELGVERFILDDGWFGSRRSDRSGLGDWWVSPEVYPNGLGRIVERVRGHGMEFGLWFEPEMVNPDSELYRAHPDWVLAADGVEPIPSRHQLVLDLTRPEVSDHLFARISALVDEYAIDYIKWDMNRDIQHPGSAGRGAAGRQTRAVYGLMARLRDHAPNLEIESCASGGGRADFGALRFTDRVWLSDNNDAGDRQSIQRGASHFLPLAISGSHVGPRQCHITQRIYDMRYRAGTAVFGHMGLEVDLNDERAEDLEILRDAIALHKRHRELIHGGRHVRLETPAHQIAFGVVAPDRREALFSCAQVAGHGTTLPGRLHFAGLAPDVRYRLRLVWPTADVSPTSPSIVERADLLGAGCVLAGEALMQAGMQLPLTYPDRCLIYHLRAEDDRAHDGDG